MSGGFSNDGVLQANGDYRCQYCWFTEGFRSNAAQKAAKSQEE